MEKFTKKEAEQLFYVLSQTTINAMAPDAVEVAQLFASIRRKIEANTDAPALPANKPPDN